MPLFGCQKGKKTAGSDAESVDSMAMDMDQDDDDDFEEPAPKKAAKASTTRGKAGASKAAPAKGRRKNIPVCDIFLFFRGVC